ncbi:type II toxin-antitoxin system Phd/YefM family antitoxin [Streptococcus sp. zg-JUN1979]|uniref:type II toxin-antitoxin system Phd/YefM family antitoxin n=1 Tax=Streptococcus sp. zg-JUN1979 TaxID=3391450 RepID=UPI0039A62474
MLNISMAAFCKDMYRIVEQTIRDNQPVKISTQNGNVVVISQEEYNSMVETSYLLSVPGLKKQLIEDRESRLEEFVPEDKVRW